MTTTTPTNCVHGIGLSLECDVCTHNKYLALAAEMMCFCGHRRRTHDRTVDRQCTARGCDCRMFTATSETLPAIKRRTLPVEDSEPIEYFDIYSPDGKLAATFQNEHFLEMVCQKMFDLSPFDSIRNYMEDATPETSATQQEAK